MSITRLHGNQRMSQIVIHGDTVYLAGQVAADPGSDITEQTQQVLQKIDNLLEEAGSHKNNILSAQIWLTSIGHFAQIGVFSTLASLLFFDRSAGVIYMFGASATALAAIAAMFSLVRGGKLSLAGTSAAAAFAIKLCLILVVYSFAVIEDQLALWGLLSGLFLLDAFPFLFLTVLLWRGGRRPEPTH